MKFRTIFTAERADFTLSPEHPVVMLGSCFSDNIAAKMRGCLWNAVNPGGTLYNPISIKKAIDLFLFEKDFENKFKASLFTDAQGKSRSFFGDFRFAAEDEGTALDKAQDARNNMQQYMKEAEALFVTFGTAICYSLLPMKEWENPLRPREELLSNTVANCHKLPASRFDRFRLTVDEIVDAWVTTCQKIKETYPHIRIVFTVSPVRHLKDGFTANSRSKATLLLAVEEICRRLSFCSYFPAYEILNDDLRDYRFYASDLAHPSEQAVDYIWEIFKETYLDNEALLILKEGEKIFKSLNHRPLLMSEEEEREYQQTVQKKYQEFMKRHPLCGLKL